MNYTLLRAHKRSLSLQVTPTGELIARAPYLMPKFLVDQFVKEKSSWVAKRRQELSQPVAPKIEHFTEAELKKFIEKVIKKHSVLMDLHPTGLRFTRVSSYWGTCSSSGVLSFNLALRFTPPPAVTYVVVHELAHLQWKGHGQRFWNLVQKHYPETKAMRKLLRAIPRYSLT